MGGCGGSGFDTCVYWPRRANTRAKPYRGAPFYSHPQVAAHFTLVRAIN